MAAILRQKHDLKVQVSLWCNGKCW